MKEFLRNMSIGLRLKLAVSILVSVIIIILGIILYSYQKDIIFEQAKKNSYASIDDLIRFTDNEIDASRDKIGYFGQAALNCLDAMGTYSQSSTETYQYYAHLNYAAEAQTLEVPAIYRGDTRLQGDTTLLKQLLKIGIEFFIYYQKTDQNYIEIICSENQTALKENHTFIFPLDYLGFWRLSSEDEPIVTFSHWSGRWLQTIRLFTYDENNVINGAIVLGIRERNENKLAQTFRGHTFYESGICYTVSGDGIVTNHPTLPVGKYDQDSSIHHLISAEIKPDATYFIMKDSTGIEKYFFYKYHPANFNSVVIEIPEKEIFSSLYALRNGIIIAILVMVLCIYLLITYIVNAMTNRLDKAVNVLEQLALGDTKNTNNLLLDRNDEIGHIANSVNGLKQNLNKISAFATAIGQGELDTKYHLLSENDELGNSLIEMQKSLIKAKEDQKMAQIEEEKKRWASNGLAKFSEIIRLSDNDIKTLAYNILKNMVDYLDITMGALYIAEEENNTTVFVPQAAVAYERKKILNKKILVGEGLVGRCAFKKLTIYMTDIPKQYITIRSGLGEANPGYLLIVPLIANDEVLGVIELASFNVFEDYKREFVEKMAENIGSTLNSAKINQQTIKLLEQSKIQSEELAAQEEEMRQNMEELQSTQEEAHRREAEMMGVIDSINQSVFKIEYNMNGNIININQKYAQFLKSDTETMLHQDINKEFSMLGLSDNNSEHILRQCVLGNSYSATIKALVAGSNYSIEEHYKPIVSIEKESTQRIIKISYIVAEK